MWINACLLLGCLLFAAGVTFTIVVAVDAKLPEGTLS